MCGQVQRHYEENLTAVADGDLVGANPVGYTLCNVTLH